MGKKSDTAEIGNLTKQKMLPITTPLRLLSIASLFLLSVHLCHSRMGETREELIKRYGKPIGEDKNLNSLLFEKNGYRFEATLLDGVTEAFTVYKANGSPLLQDEVREFVARNKGDHNYKQTINDLAALQNFDCDYMVSDDGQRWVVLKSASPNTIERGNAYLNVIFMTTRYRYWVQQVTIQNVEKKERERLDSIKRKTEGF